VQNNDTQQTNVTTQKASVGTAEAGIKVAAANEQAQQATVDRLVTLTQFEEVRAPFDGIVVTRGVDVGDLVNADSKTGASLFTVAKDAVIRTTVHIPQTNAVAIHDGLEASVAVPQIPNRTFTGKIARSSVALLNSSRTLTTEVDIQNPDGALRPGLFVNVTFEIPRLRPNIVVPAEALIFNQAGLQVAVVQDDQVHLQKITIYRDLGKTVELESGLNGGEAVVLSPPADLQEGAKVKVEPKKPEEQAQK
jgi:HlyD family secretion protein